MIGRKNGKSELLAAIVCAVLFLDDAPGAQLYSAAAKREQAFHVFTPVRRMIERAPDLAARARVFRGSIEYRDRVYKPIAADAALEHGGRTHLAVIDEIHAQPNRDLVDVLDTSMLADADPLLLSITTADFERESICNEKRRYAQQVRDGVIPDPRFLPVLYCAEKDDDWKDPATWAKANPNMGVSFSVEELERLAKKAEDVPGFLNTFLRLHLCITAQQASHWLSLVKWDACAGEPISREILRGRECWGGLDLSSTTDLTAFALAFPNADGSFELLPFFWVPEASADRRERVDRVPYRQWIREGWIAATPGETVDYERVRADIGRLGEEFRIREIAADRWSAEHLLQLLEADGFSVAKHGQGFAGMSGPSKLFETLVVNGRLHHGGHPVLRWNASHVVIDTDAAANIKPTKKKSAERIDGIVAGAMAVGRAASGAAGRSIYETRGLFEPETQDPSPKPQAPT